MASLKFFLRMIKKHKIVTPLVCLLLLPYSAQASFIESTIGTAVVNDATATYYNPAALMLLKNPQLITMGSAAYFDSRFNGQIMQTATRYSESGHANTKTHYYLPSFYMGVPIHKNFTVGFGIIYNYFYRNMPSESVLRYVQSSNRVNNIDFVPALGIKINDAFAIGAGLNLSHANVLLEPTTGFPSLNIADLESHNESSGASWGEHIGFLVRPSRTTLVGFNYRSAITYHLSGESVFKSTPPVVSKHYGFKFWTPARSVLSVNQFITPTLGLIGTIQRIQWSIFKNINLKGVAFRVGSTPVILSNVSANFRLRDTWLFTVGSHYRVSPIWVIRIAGSYMQSPASPRIQIANGDNIIIGASTGYQINKSFTLDAGYAHAFIENQHVQVNMARNVINGVNKGFRDAFSLKLTFNVV